MQLWDSLVLAVGLALAPSAVSVCKGLSVPQLRAKHYGVVGLCFGGFQACMPLLGYFLGSRFQSLIERIDHWIAFALLMLIGINMLRESFGPDEVLDADFSLRAMLPLAIATSIDALAVGITFAFLQVNIFPAVSCIGVITFLLSILGLKLGHIFGAKYRAKAELAGGIVLILMGTKILLEHLGVFEKIGSLLHK